jgi:ADP-ribose pyrophosphatase YjhB (NUDIX family)
MTFCSTCGHQTVKKIPAGDDHLRDVCEACGAIHYQNPKVIVGTLPVYNDKVLLCRRAIDPRYGFWTLPAGFLELGESTWQGAQRETREEAGAIVHEGHLYGVFDLPYISQVYMFYLAEVADGSYQAGTESLEVAWFEEADIPWDELAFTVIGEMLRRYFDDRKREIFSTYHCVMQPRQEAWRKNL